MNTIWKKRVLGLILALAMVLLCACANKQPEPTAAPTEAPTQAVTEAPTEAPTEEPAEEPEAEEATEEPAAEPEAEEATEEPAAEPKAEEATEEPAEEPEAEEATEEPAAEPEAEEATEEPAAEPKAEEATEEPAAEPKAEAPAELDLTDPSVFAYVNGKPMTAQDVQSISDNIIAYYSQYGQDMTDPVAVQQVHQVAMDYSLQMALINGKAAEWGLDTLTDEERQKIEADVDVQWDDFLDTALSYYFPVAEDATEEEKQEANQNAVAFLESMGYTRDTLLKDALDNEIYERVYAHVVEGVEVTDEEIESAFAAKVAEDEAQYKDNVSAYEYNNMLCQYYGDEYAAPSYYTPAGYRGVIQILLEVDEELMGNYTALTAQLEEQEESANNASLATPTDLGGDVATPTDLGTDAAPVTAADVENARQAILASVQPQVDAIKSRLEAGEAFEDLIKEYNIDPGMEDEENLKNGYAVHLDSSSFDPAFVQASFSVNNVGDVAEPVVSDLGYGVYIVKYLRDIPEGAVELTDSIRNTIRESLLADKENEVYNNTMDLWHDAAEIVYTDAGNAYIAPVAAEEDAALATPTDLE